MSLEPDYVPHKIQRNDKTCLTNLQVSLYINCTPGTVLNISVDRTTLHGVALTNTMQPLT